MSEEKQYPSITQQAKNFTKTAFDIVNGIIEGKHPIMVSDEVKAKREETCRACDWYDDVDGGKCKDQRDASYKKIPLGISIMLRGIWGIDEEAFNKYFEKKLDKEGNEE